MDFFKNTIPKVESFFYKNLSSSKQHTAFTLAEVLITLGIIGIVASLTIPTLMAKYKKMQYVVALKRDYSEWNQALLQMSADSGTPGDLSSFFDSSDNDVMGDKISKYFKTVKTCKYEPHESGCFANAGNWNYDGSQPSTGFDNWGYRFITADGMSIAFYNITKDCNSSKTGSYIQNLKKICVGTMLIDVNGLKGPNYMGRDMFEFYITTGKGPTLYPEGAWEDRGAVGQWGNVGEINNCSKDINPFGYSSGFNCAARIMEQGWQMNY